ncbi:MAG: hypothetical protein ABIF82_06330 [Planctomycetota bacterium]
MKARMILAALIVCGAVVAMQAPASAALITNTYLVGDKDDFNNGDGDGVFDLVHGDVIPLPYWTYLTPEAGNTDYQMYPALAAVFDFAFTVGPLAVGETIVGATLRVVTWDNEDNSADYYGNLPGAWGTQPIKVRQGATEIELADKLAIDPGQKMVHVHEIPLPALTLALLEGGVVHVTIGALPADPDWDVIIVDYAELDITYDARGGDPVSETSAAALLTVGLSGLIRRKRR